MADVKQVKVDNWGIYFLQRLKHFFNRTDYCDLTLQFQDNAQLKVHRLVLSACTEYFELLERTCEMYEDCLVMPDDLQADVVVPIVNFMYTGQLEFKMDLLEKLHQTSEIMNMPVLTKLLDSHRPKHKITHSYNAVKRVQKHVENIKETIKSATPTEVITTTGPVSNKRSYSKAFEKTTIYRDKKVYLPINKVPLITNGSRTYREPSPIPLDHRFNKKVVSGDPRPTRYELPEELDADNIFENSFCNISYTSQPLMIHPDTRKQYSKRSRSIGEASSSKKFKPMTVDIVDCKKVTKGHEEILFEDSIPATDETDMFPQQFETVKAESSKDSNQLFDQILEHANETPKVTIETKNAKSTANLDHAKIISEVLKKYPHLVKSNKNIKLKILNTSGKNIKKQKLSPMKTFEKPVLKTEKEADYTFETDVLDSKQAARLIALGADNVEGPWICLICGTPGKAMNFTSYYKFRRHLVEVHNEKPVLNICEYCGQKCTKRNNLLHHMYTKHGVEPPPLYHFPKCNHCSYIALSEGLLVKHKATQHAENKIFRCNVCAAAFNLSNQLLMHIQSTGHKYSTDRKSNLQCIYCQKVFMRESNLCAHLKAHHKGDAIRDGIIDDSDDEMPEAKLKNINVKTEPSANDFEELDIQYQIQQQPDGNIRLVTKKSSEPVTSPKQKILNSGLTPQVLPQKNKTTKTSVNSKNEYLQEINMSATNDTHEEIVMIDNVEYIMRDNQLVPRRAKQLSDEFVLPDHNIPAVTHTTSMEFTNIHNTNVQENIQQANMILKNTENLNQPIPIYVSNEEEYKALMASNQSIIFDSADSNKTLTVLTAPHTSTLETTAIDLDSTQSSDMMIIQNEFPLNVSEAVASDNSNIVVVYSHQVGDQNKQFQLLTTQGLGTQFVQSSAILTQNYETVTTTAPIMHAHVLDKQVEDVWQSNLQQIIDTDQIEITPVTTLQSIVETNEVQINSTDSNTDLNELPNVQLVPNVHDANNINTTDTAISQQMNMITEEVPIAENLNENTVEQVVDNTQNISSMEVDEEIPIENSIDETVCSTTPDAASENEPLITQTIGPENDTVMQQIDTVELEQETNSHSATENVNEILQQSEDMSICNVTTEIENNSSNNIDEHVSEPATTSDVPVNAEQDLAAEHTPEKVQALTSEWSEEDMEANQVETVSQDNNGKTDVQETNIQTCEELEESIENIQQEVEKQIKETSASTAIIENDVEINNTAEVEINEPDINEPEINNTAEEVRDEDNNPEVTVTTVPAVAQEKISSILNDWEDNDSQEDNHSVQEDVPTESDAALESAPIETTEDLAAEKQNLDKPDNIKSLVSDWDEDDEENKE